MRLRNRKLSSAIQIPNNENSSQVLASSVGTVWCPEDLEDHSSPDSDRFSRERLSVTDADASCSTPSISPTPSCLTPSYNSPSRILRMKTRSQTQIKSPKHTINLKGNKFNIVLNKVYQKDPSILSNLLDMECKVVIDKTAINNDPVKPVEHKQVEPVDLLNDSLPITSDLEAILSTDTELVNRNIVSSGLNPSASIIDLENACGSGELSNAQKCKNPSRKQGRSCVNCLNFKPTNLFTSTQTHRIYSIINHEKDTNNNPIPIGCKTTNCIYLMTCATCHLQYVGETSQKLAKRWTCHRSGMKGNPGHVSCKRIVNHWTQGKCIGSHFHLQIIENMIGDGKTKGEGVDRRKRETYWIQKLRTAYPYGLNDRIGNEYEKVNCEKESIGKYFTKVGRYINRSLHCRHTRATKSKFTVDTFLDTLVNNLQNDLPNVPNFIRISLNTMKKSDLRIIYTKLHEKISNEEGETWSHWYKMACDTIECKIYKPPTLVPPKKPSKYRISILFDNKSLDSINLQSILMSKETKDNSPPLMDKDDIPKVTYSMTESVRSSLFNYGKFVDELDLDKFEDNKESIPCNCANVDPKFVDDHHKHVITGDLSIIENYELRGVFKKGPKFREPREINFKKSRELIGIGINQYIETIGRDKGLHSTYFASWKQSVLNQVDSKIEKLEATFTKKKIEPILKSIKVQRILKELHNNYVTVPIDKAQNNVAFICKQFYAEILSLELKKDTYERIFDDKETLIQNHVQFLSTYKLKVNEDFKQLPRIYWTPKMHKNPVGTRFIIGNPLSSLKPLTKDITQICKLFLSLMTSYYNKVDYMSGTKHLWIAQNNNDLIEFMERTNEKGKAKSIATYDFSSLYTHIPHDKLIFALNEIVDFAFDGGTCDYISVTKSGANFVKNQSTKKVCYTRESTKQAIAFIMENCFFTVGNRIYRQVIGIPMGSDPAPFFANFFLAFYESKYIKSLKSKDPGKARKYKNITRYIDDLIAPNDNNEFHNSFLEIYPAELQLNKENSSNDAATFLDLDIKIIDNKFVTKLYDKRDSYNFDIVRLPHKCSNIPSKMFYNTLGAEILRICRATSVFDPFKASVCSLMNRVMQQGGTKDGVNNVFRKTMNRHWDKFVKYNKSQTLLIKEIKIS